MEKDISRLIPVKFQKVNQFDDRFVQVKIWLMHTGLNYNGSIFQKESVEQAFPTLKNTPILAYIQEDESGDKDFAGHEMELVVEDGEYKFKYLGKAVGVIPENCNPRWEQKMGDYGEMLDYLVVDGLMWSKFDDAVDIVEDSGEVSQSMELHDNYDGHFDENGNFHFTKFSFYGACLLGSKHEPAMQKASVELYSKDSFAKSISEKMEEFKNSFGKFNYEKEGNKVDLKEILEKYGVTAEQLEEKEINVDNYSLEELKAKIKEEFEVEEESPESSNDPELSHESGSDNSSESGSEGDGNDPEEEFESNETNGTQNENESPEGEFEAPKSNEDKDQKVYRKFALSHGDVRIQLWDKLDTYVEEKGLGERWDFWISEVYDDYFIAENDSNRNYYKVSYSKENDAISLGDHVQVFAQYLTADEKGALEMMRSNYEKLEEELNNLKEFEKKALKSEHEAQAESLFAEVDLEEEDYKDIKENVHNFTIEEIEEKLYARLGRKNFSLSNQTNKVAVTQEGNKQPKPYGGLFSKYGMEK